MEITRTVAQQHADLHIAGRLDSYWASHLSTELESLVRAGVERITLDFRDVAFLSSAGISVLLRYYRRLREGGGNLRIVHPIDLVRSVLDHSGLTGYLLAEDAPPPVEAPHAERIEARELPSGTIEFSEIERGVSMRCRIIGVPTLELAEGNADEVTRVRFERDMIGIGIGALASDAADSLPRLGEFLAAGGAFVFLPSDGTNVPDYLLASGSLVPEPYLLYGTACAGKFSAFARFRVRGDAPGIPLSELAGAVLDVADSDTAAFVAIAETTGLVGAALRRSPARPDHEPFFSHPGVRARLSFTSESAHARASVLLAGLVSHVPHPALAPFLRPLAPTGTLLGHIHAMAASYHAVRVGVPEIHDTVAEMFGEESVLGVLHLLNDTRPAVGQGESEFTRGVCWLSPVRGYE